MTQAATASKRWHDDLSSMRRSRREAAAIGLFIRHRHVYGAAKSNQNGLSMADHVIPHFHNDSGATLIEIGVTEFMCVGARPPYDHPHIFIDLGDDGEKVCAYCSTLYRYNATLKATETVPPGHLFVEPAPV